MTPIAVRDLATEDGRTVTIEIYAPEPDPDDAHGGTRCAFRLSGAIDVQRYARGEDALQALTIAFQGLRKYIDDSGLVLTWGEMETGDHGVPLLVLRIFGLQFTRELEAEIDRRMVAHRPLSAPPLDDDE